MPAKLKLETIKQRLEDRNIQMLGEYTHSHAKYEFVCDEEGCGWHWKTKLNAIFNGTGCPMCNGKPLITNTHLDALVKGTGIKRIGDYSGGHNPIDWEHEECGTIFPRAPKLIRAGTLNCPICTDRRFTNEIVDEMLIGRNIKRLGKYINNKTPIKWQCLEAECLYIWITAPGVILNRGCGCPRCCGTMKLTNADIDFRLEGRNIRRLGEYVDIFTKIDWECLVCMNIWFSRPSYVITSGHGCPRCPLGKSEKMVGDFLAEHNIAYLPQTLLTDIVASETRRLLVDYYLPQHNIIVEYNGDQHYRPIEFHGMSKELAASQFIRQQERDQYLQHVCDENGIELKWIDGRKYAYNKLRDYLRAEFIPSLLKASNE